MIYSALRAPLRISLRAPQDRIVDELRLGLELLANGDFSAGAASWAVNNEDSTHIVTFAGGVMRYQSGTTSPQLNVQQAGVLTVGKKYQVAFDVSAFASGALKSDMGTPGIVVNAGPGTYTYRVTAVSTTFNMTRSTANVDITIDKVSIREILS